MVILEKIDTVGGKVRFDGRREERNKESKNWKVPEGGFIHESECWVDCVIRQVTKIGGPDGRYP